jgi:hypothetical protein
MDASKRIGTSAIALALCVALFSGAAWADRGRYHNRGHSHSHGHASFGFYFGGPLWYPGPAYYPYSYPYYPAPAVVVPPAPRVYIERDDQPLTAAPSPSSPYWYYCRESEMYYPYARECSIGWERVPARPQ